MFPIIWRRWHKPPTRTSKQELRDRKRPKSHLLILEPLEERVLLATWSGDVFDTTPGTPLWTNTAVQEIVGNVHVPAGKTLSVQPGTMVKFDSATSLTVDGMLLAQGIAANPILFTSIRDGSGAAPADWGRLEFTSTSTGSVLDHVEVRYGGGVNAPLADVFVNGGALTLTNSIIRSSYQVGVRIVGSNPTLTGDTFQNNGAAAISMDLGSHPTIHSPIFIKNPVNGLALDGGDLPASTAWDNPDVVYWLTSPVTVPQNMSLTVAAGQVVKLGPLEGGKILVNGTLTARGTDAQPVIFTSIQDDQAGGDTNNDGAHTPGNGDWQRLEFSSTSTANVLDHVEVRYGGTSQTDSVLAAVYDNRAPLALTNSLIRNSYIVGLRVVGASPTLSGDRFQDNSHNGSTGAPAAISMDLASHPAMHGLAFSNNPVNGVALDGGDLPGNTTWDNTEVVYWLTSPVTVPQNMSLTVAAGQVVKLGPSGSGKLLVNGTLTARGTAAQPIIFTSIRDDTAGGDTDNDMGTINPGNSDWQRLEFSSTSTANVLDHVEVRYGGTSQTDSVLAAVYDNGAPLALTNSLIRNSYIVGLRVVGANPTLSGDRFQDNSHNGSTGAPAAISMDLASHPALHGLTFSNNPVNGVALDGGDLPGNTTWDNTEVVYWLTSPVTVPQNMSLTVAAGQVVKLGPLEGGKILVNGTLTAQGTAAHPIVFTSIQDDQAGGDTNNDHGATNPAPGDWGRLEFTGTSTANVLDHVEVRYGGTSQTDSVLAAVYDNRAPLVLTNSLVRNSYIVGLRVVGASPTLSGDTFQDNSRNGSTGAPAAISMDLASHPAMHSLTFSNNPVNGVAMDGGTLPANTTWDNPEVVYWLEAPITVPTGLTLTVVPGQVVKSGNGLGKLLVNGTLKAQGTAAQPIIFTTWTDDSAGGDTNNDGPSIAGASAWLGMEFTSTSTGSVLDHVELRDGNGAGPNAQGMIEVNGGALTLTNSVLRDVVHDVFIAGTGAVVTLNSNVILNGRRGVYALAGSRLTAANNTIDGNRSTGVELDSATATLTNNLITNSGFTGVVVTGTPTLAFTYNDVFHSGTGNYSGLTDPTGTNGNLSIDPNYFNRANLQYELHPGSPAEDAGTSAGAPATDFFGNPRFKDPNITGRGDGSGYDMGAIEVQQVATSNVDLATTSVSGPTTGTQDQTATVSWTVQNLGSGTATGSWSDAVYLSDTPVFTPDARFLGRVTHTGDLGPGKSYAGKASVTLHNVLPGNHYFIVRCNDLNDIFEGVAVTNNAAASPTPISFAMPTLTVDTPYSDRFTSPGQASYYQISVAAGQTLALSLQSAATDGSTELYVSRGAVPSRSQFDFSGGTVLAANQQVVVPTTQPGTYYVLAYAGYGSASNSAYTLTAHAAGFSAGQVLPNTAGNGGPVTLTITGTQLTAATQASLVAGGTVIPATAIQFGDAAHLYATFDLTGRATGAYDLRLTQGTQTATAPAALTVTAGTPGHLTINFDVPGMVRAGHEGTLTVDYVNDGGADLAAPILVVAADHATLRYPDQANFAGPSLEFLAINSSGPAGVLPPGAHGSIKIGFVTTADASTTNFTLSEGINSGLAFNWNAAKDNLRPPFEPADAWNALYASFMADVGTTVGQFQALLDKEATYLSQLGEYVPDETQLLALAFEQAGDFGAISQRYTLGAFGRGVPDPTDVSALTDATTGDVTIRSGGKVRRFFHQIDGSYRGATGDLAVLTLSGGAYRLQETDGSIRAFKASGQLDYIQDTNGNKVTAVYGGGRLTGFTDSFGNSITIASNAQGRISQTTDPVGRITTYAYDASGEHLVSITDPSGTTQIAYVTGQGAAREHAVQSITFADGTHAFFEYDDRGRLTRQSLDTGAQDTHFAYDGAGGVTTTDAAGASTSTLVNEFGQLGLTLDALGNVTRLFYDAHHHLTRVVGPDGSTSTIGYNDRDNPIQSVDPLGQKLNATFDPALNRLLTLRDPRGNSLNYTDDARGNPLAVTYPDGSAEHFTYNPAGNLTDSIDRRGNPTHYTYDAHNLLTREDFADGTHADFGYDAHRNLISATNPNGTTSFAYDAADRLTQVTYPSGRFLKFTYDAAGRRTRSVDQDGFTVNYAYDSVGRLAGLTDGTGGRIVAYTYDSVGRLARKDFGNGTFTTYSYDLNGQVKNLVNSAPDGSVVSRFDYTYDTLGRTTSVTTLDGKTTYGYDGTGQLTSVALPSGRTITYQYDAAGNRISVTDGGITTSYVTNNLNQYTTVGTAHLVYDGNLVSRTDASGTTTYGYDALGRLVSVITPTDTYTYQYDALGNRIATIHNGQRTEDLIDPARLGNVVAEYDGSGTVLAHYTYGAGLTSQVTASGANYYGFDAQGNTAHLTDRTGTVLNRYSYLPFGETLAKTGTSPNPFTFVGQAGVINQGDGLAFARARFQLPILGRFIQPDPTGIVGGVNLYAYAHNNPVSFIDPSGHEGISVATAAGAISTIVESVAAVLRDTLTHPHLNYLSALAATISVAFESTDFGQTREGHYLAQYGSAVATSIGLYLTAAAAAAAGTATVVSLAGVFTALSTFFAVLSLSSFANEFFINPLHNFIQDSLDKYHSGEADHDLAGQTMLERGYRIGLINEPLEHILAIIHERYIHTVFPKDPNALSGPQGFGTQHFVTPDATLPYTILFENTPTATAAAQTVTVTQQLAANLDWTTFQLGNFGFGSYVVQVPDGRRFYSTRVDATATTGLFVDVTGTIDLLKGIVTWTFTSIDPATGAAPTAVLAGFLPPDDSTKRGEGFVTYRIQPKRGLATGAAVNAQASIVFDTNAPLATPQFVNTIDAGPPTSTVTALPATEPTTFNVSWSGTDDTGGSGIATYNVYVADNGGGYTLWQPGTTQTSATYTGQDGHTYAFYSVATDNVGNQEAKAPTSEATTRIDATPPTSSVAALPSFSKPAFTVTWSGSDNAGGSGLSHIDVYVSDNGGSYQQLIFIPEFMGTSIVYTGVAGHTYSFYSIATDKAGNLEATPSTAQATTQTLLDTPFKQYVAAVYVDLLLRSVDLGGLSYWSSQIDHGTPRQAVAKSLTHSAEYYQTNVIKPAYLKFLNRAADQAGLDFWTQQLQNGTTDEQMQAGFIASDEFYASANHVAAPLPPSFVTPAHDRVWVDALYLSLLGRGLDQSGEDFWTGQLQGPQTRIQVANGFTGSTEGLGLRIQQTYQRYLGRGADAGGLAFWLTQYHMGAVNEDIVTGFIGSDEFFRQATM